MLVEALQTAALILFTPMSSSRCTSHAYYRQIWHTLLTDPCDLDHRMTRASACHICGNITVTQSARLQHKSRAFQPHNRHASFFVLDRCRYDVKDGRLNSTLTSAKFDTWLGRSLLTRAFECKKGRKLCHTHIGDTVFLPP